jgi:hypothetical protein
MIQTRRDPKRKRLSLPISWRVEPFAVPTSPDDDHNKINKKQKKRKSRTIPLQQSKSLSTPTRPESRLVQNYLSLNATKNRCQNLHCFNVDATRVRTPFAVDTSNKRKQKY